MPSPDPIGTPDEVALRNLIRRLNTPATVAVDARDLRQLIGRAENLQYEKRTLMRAAAEILGEGSENQTVPVTALELVRRFGKEAE